ncbi:SDR family oxidoreductase [uncultured Enterococcus sp.]|uniref:SDR family NAD(P)-dependent oxidoreductase n=1 Tax=uncultured Enterococcus sp. TaxID=167972 RepID=UPI0025F612C5|nr:SDR family oxidoreductase [uncultured Enterococcus sp.]
MKLKGKVVFVTGASGGLGKKICYEAAKQGAIVVACARRIDELTKVKQTCMSLSKQQAFCYQLDVANPEQVDQVLHAVALEVGPIDVLVNNAGFGVFDEFVSFDFDTTRRMFEVNVLGLMYITQKIAAEMVRVQKGSIINIASIAGKIATPKTAVYSATKFAVLGFSNALRLELKPFGIHVTTVNPGPMETNFFNTADPSGNYVKGVKPFLSSPEVLAKKIVRTMTRPKREINQPKVMNTAAKAYTLFPRIGDFLAGGIMNKK